MTGSGYPRLQVAKGDTRDVAEVRLSGTVMVSVNVSVLVHVVVESCIITAISDVPIAAVLSASISQTKDDDNVARLVPNNRAIGAKKLAVVEVEAVGTFLEMVGSRLAT